MGIVRVFRFKTTVSVFREANRVGEGSGRYDNRLRPNSFYIQYTGTASIPEHFTNRNMNKHRLN